MPEEGRESWSRSVCAPGSSLEGRSWGAVGSQKTRADQGLQFSSFRAGTERAENRKTCTSQPVTSQPLNNSGTVTPSQTVGSGDREKPKETPQQRGQAWAQTPPSAHKPCGAKVRPGCPERGDGQTSGGALVTHLPVKL